MRVRLRRTSLTGLRCKPVSIFSLASGRWLVFIEILKNWHIGILKKGYTLTNHDLL